MGKGTVTFEGSLLQNDVLGALLKLSLNIYISKYFFKIFRKFPAALSESIIIPFDRSGK